MLNITCNIDKSDRTNRIVIGTVLILGALVGFSTIFMMIVGLILIAEGAIGWCGIPMAVEKIKSLFNKQNP